MMKGFGLIALIALIGAAMPTAVAARVHHHLNDSYSTGRDYYTAASGHQVHRPVQAATVPAGASAKCRDGSYSFSESRGGTCSHHGGVATWF